MKNNVENFLLLYKARSNNYVMFSIKQHKSEKYVIPHQQPSRASIPFHLVEVQRKISFHIIYIVCLCEYFIIFLANFSCLLLLLYFFMLQNVEIVNILWQFSTCFRMEIFIFCYFNSFMVVTCQNFEICVFVHLFKKSFSYFIEKLLSFFRILNPKSL